MRVLVVGGLTRLDAHYKEFAKKGVEVENIYNDCPSLEARAEHADALVLLLGHVSHNAAIKVRNVARRRGTPLASLMSPSVSGVRRTITELAARAG